MKIKTFKIISIFFTVLVILASCKKDDPVKLAPSLSTWDIANITSESAEVSGLVVAEGSGFSERGVCWNTTIDPTVNDSKVMVDTVKGALFNVKIEGLNYTTKYYVRAYAIGNDGSVIYGQDTTFTTLIRVPVVSIADVTNVAGKTATSGGNVTDLGGGTVSAKGLCWAKTPNPTIENDTTIEGEGLGEFITNITNLDGATQYYVRAYATNDAGTAYSNELTFTTEISSPTVETKEVKDITPSTATGVGYMWFDGGAPVTETGVCWSLNANPTLADNSATSSNLSGQFGANITGLAQNTKYHMRAYATNSSGTAYGKDIEFTSGASTLFLIGDGVGDWDWNNTDLPMVKVNGHPELFWKIVWMKATGGFKINAKKAWDGNEFGKTGTATAGVYAVGTENVPVPGTEGYYMVVADTTNKTIEIAAPQVFGMGDVFGNWNMGEHPFVVDNANKVIKFDNVPGTGDLRMYANATTLNLGGDWWRAEFIILNGKIVYREDGPDQTRVSVTAGQNVSLDFINTTGSIVTP